MTLRELRNLCERLLEGATDEASRESEILVCSVLDIDRTELFLRPEREVGEAAEARVRELADMRIKGHPLQYLLGTASFMGFDIRVDGRVLIPRPETELLAEEAVRRLRTMRAEALERGASGSLTVLDLCTGSGCIARAVSALTDASVSASDISPEALVLARENCGDAVSFVEADLFDIKGGGSLGLFDAILSNPPYIPTAVIGGLQREVRDCEPILALDGGEDGLDTVRRIIKEAPVHLRDGGFILMEIGHDQGGAAAGLAADAGLCEIQIIKDLSGHDRILSAVKKRDDVNGEKVRDRV